MINTEYKNNVHSDVVRFFQAEPFNHLILDNFIENQDFIQEVSKEVRDIPNENYDFNEHYGVQIKKRGLSQLERLPEKTRKLVEFFQSSIMIDYLEKITGITGLISDPELLGGGVHKMDSGGHLAVHVDFNIHMNTGYHRRVNALLYLNPDWQKEWEEKWAGVQCIKISKYMPRKHKR